MAGNSNHNFEVENTSQPCFNSGKQWRLVLVARKFCHLSFSEIKTELANLPNLPKFVKINLLNISKFKINFFYFILEYLKFVL